MTETEQKQPFILCHGGRLGAWCWKLVSDELRRRGQQVLAVDLDLGDPNAGARDFAQEIARVAREVARPATLVAHSLSGLVIPLVPALVPVAELAFVCAPLPVPGLSLWDQMERPEDEDLFVRESLERVTETRDTVDEDLRGVAIDIYYHDVPPELARWAVNQLRPQVTRVTEEVTPLTDWPEQIPVRYILGRHDRIVSPNWARREVPRRLGVVPIEMNTGHSPYLADPRGLVDALIGPSRRLR